MAVMKPPCVYALPGTMCDDRLWGALQLDFTLVHTPIPSESSIENIISSLANSLPNEPVDLLGFSLGGYLASAFCARYPERVKRLCVIANSPSALPEQEIKQRNQLLSWVKKRGYSGISKAKLAFMLHECNHENTELFSLIKAMDHTCGAEVLIQQLEATSVRENLIPKLATVPTPMHFLYGEQDRLVNEDVIQSLVESRHQAYNQVDRQADHQADHQVSHELISHAGHMSVLEAPQTVSAQLNKWFVQ